MTPSHVAPVLPAETIERMAKHVLPECAPRTKAIATAGPILAADAFRPNLEFTTIGPQNAY